MTNISLDIHNVEAHAYVHSKYVATYLPGGRHEMIPDQDLRGWMGKCVSVQVQRM